jgi:hypothetical protein
MNTFLHALVISYMQHNSLEMNEINTRGEKHL